MRYKLALYLFTILGSLVLIVAVDNSRNGWNGSKRRGKKKLLFEDLYYIKRRQCKYNNYSEGDCYLISINLFLYFSLEGKCSIIRNLWTWLTSFFSYQVDDIGYCYICLNAKETFLFNCRTKWNENLRACMVQYMPRLLFRHDIHVYEFHKVTSLEH